ncbi:hypothetical protein BHE97_04730 [Aeromicrobium sp. PE09-221]|uniref:TetR/AcrR family transcriptional regulator n=1 Tax=Aeromicrobium sp. PE09-221 TaxID=1898043 RepID=UPI000B3E4D80|nr:TetR/AcrR family transcriptional regulator [Aeromicrobium sp. PE09-221]OUZ11161.1 hypothetical protein BHE97_04730 [Aeromicrobium sp. PE09-221]
MAARPKTPRGMRTQDRLLAAAIESFSAKGFHGASTRDIARAAGISPTALYVHHASKEELLFELAYDGHRVALGVVEQALGTGGTVTARLHRVVHDFAVHHAEFHELSRVVNYELAALAVHHRAEVLSLRRRISVLLRELIDEGADSGVFTVLDRRMSVAAIESLIVDIGRWYHDDGLEPALIAAAYADMALRLVGAEQHD